MKLHLNLSLRRALLAAFTTVTTISTINTAQGSVLYSSVGMQTYTDFGQNMGRYQAGRVNAVLSAIRERDGGVTIEYKGDKFEGYTYTLEHGMIDFSSASGIWADAAVGYGFLATVQHNGVQNPAYASPIVGDQYAVHYSGIEYRNGTGPFLLTPATDYKITRLSKLVTDVRTSDVYNDMSMKGEPLTGQLLYRVGSGSMSMIEVDENGMGDLNKAISLRGAYSYGTGGLVTIDNWAQRETQEGGDFNYSVNHTVPGDVYSYITGTQASGQVNPLPYSGRAGDSGSPSWVWNEKTGTYQYLSALQSGGGTFTQDRGAWAWTLETMDSFNKEVALGADTTIHFGAVNTKGQTISGKVGEVSHSVTQHLGTITTGGQTVQFAGVQSGVNTWNDLNAVKDSENWYAYDMSYLNGNGDISKADGGKINYGELMYTDNIILKAASSSLYTVQLDDTVDTGIGFVQFSKAEGLGSASFKIVSQAGEQNQFNTAGFVVDKGVTLDIALTGDSSYLREWRKVGEGDLRISGEGNNFVLLNVGGGSVGTNDGRESNHTSGKVYLDRTNGYAAYNVLASTGSTVVLKDIAQVKRDVTLGVGGATLDLNGNDYTWDNSTTENGFTLHMLTEQDILANYGNRDVTVTITDAGDTLLGSLEDSASGAMKVVYAGGKELVMHSIYTDLSHNDKSGFTVQSGSVSLGGTITVHATGSLTGTNPDRLVNPNDWHYADAKMNVTVQNGASFTLDSHARLTGDVTVEKGGTFVMREGSAHQMEYIEGGARSEDTQSAFYSQFHGLKGDIRLQGGALSVKYNDGVDSRNAYAGSITGNASSVTFDLGNAAAIKLSGNNTFTTASGYADIISGGVIAENAAAAGYANGKAAHGWNIGERGFLAAKNMDAQTLLGMVTADSTGALALTADRSTALTNVPEGLFIGALEGTQVQYGVQGTSDTLSTNSSQQWLLGGGGGELVVNFALNNEEGTLVLGNAYTTGSVTLTNESNNIGSIVFAGQVTLDYTSAAALGCSDIHLNYGNRLAGSTDTMNRIAEDSQGAILLDKFASDARVDMDGHDELALSAAGNVSFGGSVNLGEGDSTYRFGAISGTLALTSDLGNGEGGAARNLSVDGQHFSGGVMELQTAQSLTGDVTVMGYDSTKTDTTGGDMTLRLVAADALASAGSVTLKDGGILDVNGGRQQLNNLSMAAGSVLTDSSLNGTGEAVVHSTSNTSLAGALNLTKLTKTGDATLSLTGESAASQYDVKAGTLRVDNAKAMAGQVTVSDSGTLAVGTMTSDVALQLRNGGTLAVDDGKKFTLTNVPQLGESGKGFLKGTLELNTKEDIHLEGTLATATGSNATLTITSNSTEAVRTREIDHLDIASGSTFTVERQSVNAAVDFRIHQLSGSGTFECLAGNWGTSPGVYTLDGANDFSGTMKLVSNQGYGGRAYGHFFVLENDKAAQNAVVDLTGWRNSDTGHAILAINTDNAQMKGLTSANYGGRTLVMAGAAPESSGPVPTSTRAATLTITGNGEYTFGGNISGGAQGTENGLSIVMNGTGKQTFNGNSVVLQDVTAQQGTLALGNNVTINGTMSVARGATLDIATLDLAAGKTLAVIDAADGSTGTAAKVNSNLKLNGGTLLFSGSTLSADTAALQIGKSLTKTSGISIGFTNTSALQADTRYKLEGVFSWSGVTISDAAQGPEYLTATYDTTGSGLYVTFTNKDGYHIWNGDNDHHLWNATTFGAGSATFSDSDTAVFNDTASNSSVSVDADISVGKLLVNATKDYDFSTTSGHTLTAGTLEVQGSGTTQLGSGITVSGEATVANGTLDMAAGSRVGSAAVSEGASLILHAADNTAGTISGDGALVLDMAGETMDGSSIGSIGSIAVQAGTLDAPGSLNTQSLSVAKGAALNTTDGTVLTGGDSIELAGTLNLAAAGATTITTAITADSEGNKGQINISSGTVTLGADVAAERVTVSGGALNICSDAAQEAYGLSFLENVDTLSVTNGATAQIGRTNYTMAESEMALNLAADGNGSTLKLALAQYATHTINGTFSLQNGAKAQLLDGGMRITGDTQFGAHAADHVYLTANWGKGGFILEGNVGGNGTVELQHDGAGNPALLTLTHANNSFAGTYQLDNKTRLIAANDTALENAAVNVQSGAKLLLGADNVNVRRMDGAGEIAVANNATTENRFNSGREEATLKITGEGGSFSGMVASGVSLNMAGTGTQTFSGNSAAFDGAVAVQSGTLNLNDRGMTDGATTISVGASGTLHLGTEMSLSTATINNSGLVVYDDTAWYNVTADDLREAHTYTLVNSTGAGTTQGLTMDDFRLNGTAVNWAQYSGNVSLVSTGGSAALVVGEGGAGRAVYWTGSQSNTWDLANTENWKSAGSATESYMADHVIFGKDGSEHSMVTVAAGATVTDATVTDNQTYRFLSAANLTVLGTFTVDKGASAYFADTLPNAQNTVSDGTLIAPTATIKQGTHTFNGTTTLSGTNATYALVVNGGEASFNGTTTMSKGISVNSGTTAFNGKVTVNGDITVGGQRNAVMKIGEQGVLTATTFNSNNGFSSLQVDGLMNVNSMQLSSGSNHTDYISGHGVINAGSLVLSHYSKYTISDVRMNVGGISISSYYKPGTITLQNATIGTTSSSWNTLAEFVLSGAVTVNTSVCDSTTGRETGKGAEEIWLRKALSGSGKLVKDGQGVLTVSGVNSYSGGTVIKEGALRVQSNSYALSGGDVRIEQGGALQLGYSLTARDVVLAGGAVEMAPGLSTLTATVASLTVEDSGSLGKGAVISVAGSGSTGVTLTGQEGGASILGNASLSKESDGSISLRGDGEKQTVLQNTLIDLAADTHLNLQDVVLAADSKLTDDTAYVNVQNVTLEAQVGLSTAAPVTVRTASDMTLTPTSGVGEAVTMTSNSSVYAIQMTSVENVQLSGSHLTIALSGVSQSTLNQHDWVSISLSGTASYGDTEDIIVTYDGHTATGFYQGEDHTTLYVESSALTPEPATATLSLLALAGLAARRRRR